MCEAPTGLPSRVSFSDAAVSCFFALGKGGLALPAAPGWIAVTGASKADLSPLFLLLPVC